MTSDDVICFAIRAVQFRRANDHFIFGRVRIRLERKLVAAARVACAEVHCLGSTILSFFSNVKQTFVYKWRVT